MLHRSFTELAPDVTDLEVDDMLITCPIITNGIYNWYEQESYGS